LGLLVLFSAIFAHALTGSWSIAYSVVAAALIFLAWFVYRYVPLVGQQKKDRVEG